MKEHTYLDQRFIKFEIKEAREPRILKVQGERGQIGVSERGG